MNPTAWLDYAIVGIGALALVLGIVAAILKPGPLRGRLRLVSFCCLAFALLLGSVDSILTRQETPHLVTTGTLIALKKSFGRHDVHCTFTVTDEKGTRTRLYAENSGNILDEGDQVRVQYTAFQSKVVHLDVLTGPRAGGSITDSLPSTVILGFFLFAFVMAAGIFIHKTNPNALANPSSNQRPDRV